MCPLKKVFAVLCTFLVTFSVCAPAFLVRADAVPAQPQGPNAVGTFQAGVRSSGQPTISASYPSYPFPLEGAINYKTTLTPLKPNLNFGPYVQTDSINFDLEGRFYIALQPYIGHSDRTIGNKLITYNGFKGGRVIPFYKGNKTIYDGDPVPLNQLVTLDSSFIGGAYFSGGDICYFDLAYSSATGYPVGFRVEYFYGGEFNTWVTGDWTLEVNPEYYTLCYHIPIFNYVNSTDPTVLDTVNEILKHTANIDVDLDKLIQSVNAILAECEKLNLNAANILKGLNSVLTELKAQGVNIRIIKSVLDGWRDNDGVWHDGILQYCRANLPKLASIDKNVDAIYFVLTEALKSESASMDKATSEAVQQIDNQHQQEVYWQQNAQQSYDALDMGNFTFGPVTGGITLVGKVFSDIFDVFGGYKVIFTFPLLLGIALLVIGRIGRSSRYNHNEKGNKDA